MICIASGYNGIQSRYPVKLLFIFLVTKIHFVKKKGSNPKNFCSTSAIYIAIRILKSVKFK